MAKRVYLLWVRGATVGCSNRGVEGATVCGAAVLVREQGSALLAGGARDGEIQGGDLEEE